MKSGGQIRAARGFLRWNAYDLAVKSKLGAATIRRAEASDEPQITGANLDAIRRALEGAGVIFVEENGEGPGVRMRKGEHIHV